MVDSDIGQIKADYLRYSQTAVKKNAENAVVTLLILSVDRGEEGLSLWQCKVAGKCVRDFWYIEVLKRVCVDELGLDRQIFIKASEC